MAISRKEPLVISQPNEFYVVLVQVGPIGKAVGESAKSRD
jgi:hypothetical protein